MYIYIYSHKCIGLLSLLFILREYVELIYLIPLQKVEVCWPHLIDITLDLLGLTGL